MWAYLEKPTEQPTIAAKPREEALMKIYDRLIGSVALFENAESLHAEFSADSVTGTEDLTIRGETGPVLVLSGMTTRDKRRLVRVLLGQIRREAKMHRSPSEFFVLRSETSHYHSMAEAEKAGWLAEREHCSTQGRSQ